MTPTKAGWFYHRNPGSDWRVVEVCEFTGVGLRYQRDGGWHELAGEFAACLRGESVNGELLAHLRAALQSLRQVGMWSNFQHKLEAAISRAESRPVFDPAQQERMRAALTALYQSLPQIDNGRCAVCRIGWRNYEQPHATPGSCSNPDCLSHVVLAALGEPS